MKRWQVVLIVILVLLILATGVAYSQRRALEAFVAGSYAVDSNPQTTPLHLPPGFQASVFSAALKGPRFIAFSPDGILFVAERDTGNILALPASPDTKHGVKTSHKVIVISGLDNPTSLVFYQGALYVGEASQVSRFTLDANLNVTSHTVIVPHLPTGGNHSTHTVLVGPDGNLYVSIGSTCNVCIETNPQRATVWMYQLDGSGGRLYAKGLRNAVGMAINPWNNQIWVTNNGRDLLGDNTPPETVYALQDGGNYGWPRCHAGTIIDPDFGHTGDCNGVIAPLLKMQAHSAPLGLAFYTAPQFPSQYRGLFIAFHGSWNRSIPIGYKVVFVPLNKGQIVGSVQDFATGWLSGSDSATGRPVGLAVGPDGALYISDDGAGMIYRISYGR